MWVPCSSRRSRSSNGRRSSILLIDDAHWADVDSLRALLFALRRLVDRPRSDRPHRAGRGCAACARRPPTAGERHHRASTSPGGARERRGPDAGDGTRRTAVPPADGPAAARPHRWQPAVRAGVAVRAPGRSVAHLAAAPPGAACLRRPRSSIGCRLQPVGEIARRGLFGAGCPILAADGRSAGRARRSGGRLRGIGRRRSAAEHRQDRHLGCRVPASPGAGGRLRAREPDESDPAAPRRVRAGRRRRCRAAPPGRRHHAARTKRSPPRSMPSPAGRCGGEPGRARLPRWSRPAG